MSLMIDGHLQDDWYEAETGSGEFVRRASQFRNWITPDGAPGPSGRGGFAAEAGRYHLYVSLACPWAHRTLIYRALKGLQDLISVDVVHPWMGPQGWSFHAGPGVTGDRVNGCEYLYQVYALADPGYTGIVTVPVLWDRQHRTIVNNESSEIIRMFNSAFDALPGVAAERDFYPAALQADIDALNAVIYDDINNGVYRAGFAREQAVYEQAFDALFARLDALDARLAERRFLFGPEPLETDWRLFVTLMRFDAVYVGHFKCNRQRIADYANLAGYVRDLYQWPGVAPTFNLEHVKRHYYTSHPQLNPSGIIPRGPRLDFEAPPGREDLS